MKIIVKSQETNLKIRIPTTLLLNRLIVGRICLRNSTERDKILA